MRELLPDIERWQAGGEKVAVATVVATRRSAPRPVGSKLAVSERGELAGSVSGGCVEGDVYVAAQEVLSGGEPRLITYGITDDMALGVGLPCGGEIDVFVEPFHELPEQGVVITVIAGAGVGEKLEDEALAESALRRGRSHVIELGDRTVFADVFAPPPRLFVYGAVDTADALCAAAKILGWRTIVADARARFATPERLPNADEILLLWPEEAMELVRPDFATAIVVLTHDDKFDLPLLQTALASDAFYVGALGSRKNQARRNDLLREAGVSDDDIERIAGPSGLDIGADSPAETALSMLSEMLAVRAGRSGGRLKEAKTRIHAERVA